jgi:signal transduction histidine kinase
MECHCERISLIKLTSECIGWIQAQADNKNIQINVQIDERVFVHADYRMLATALRNILSNAVKFTHKGGKVVLSVEITGMYTKIHIKDEGIGMSREQRENVFRIDKRSSSYGTENEPGSGLGLILSKELIEKHNGILSLESKLGLGCTFTISLPQIPDTLE